MKKRLGEVHWAYSYKIDKTDKPRRQYVVVQDNGKNVKVSKIRGFNGNPKNDCRLYELDRNKYPLSKRSGVDKFVHTYKANSKEKLSLEDIDIFDQEIAFKLTNRDTKRVIQHTKSRNNKKRK